MLARYFVGVTFSESNILSKKISGFRKRFDPKFNKDFISHLSLLAPFEIETSNKSRLIEALSDNIEGFFLGEDLNPTVSLRGLGVHVHSRQNILYLNPEFEDNLKYCMESIQETCESFIPKNVHYKQNAKQFIPLGSFMYEDQLLHVMDHAKSEFRTNSELFVTGIVLFEKKFGVWTVAQELISFDTTDKFLQKQHAAI